MLAGVGVLMSAILGKYRLLLGIVLDRPHCAEGARQNLAGAGVAERAEFIAGSFFESVPRGADAIVLKSIIIDWNDERCARILQNCHGGLERGGRLTVIRSNPTQQGGAQGGSSVGRVGRSANVARIGWAPTDGSDHRDLLGESGFRVRRVVPAGRYSLIETTVL